MLKRDAFAYFGVTVTNPRNSFGGCSADGRTVVQVLWEDRFDSAGNYERRPLTREQRDRRRHGFPEFIKHMQWAIDHCGRIFRAVGMRALDPQADPREMADCWPIKGFAFQIQEFDRETGAFKAKRVLMADPVVEQSAEQNAA